MTAKVPYVYAIGDRVAERPKAHGIFAVRKQGSHPAVSLTALWYCGWDDN